MKKRRFSSDSFGSIKYFTDLQNHDSIYSCVLNTMVRVKTVKLQEARVNRGRTNIRL